MIEQLDVEERPELKQPQGFQLRFVSRDLPLENLRFLYLEYSTLRYHHLQSIVKACPWLESFRYSSIGDPAESDAEDERIQFSGRELCRALRPLNATLKNLDVDLSRSGRSSMDKFMDDLTENSALELICLDSYCLCDPYRVPVGLDIDNILAKLLPKSIKSLSLNDIRYSLFPAASRLPDMVEGGFFPNLKYFYYSGLDGRLTGTEFREKFKRAGVRVRAGWVRGWGMARVPSRTEIVKAS
ncbi:hypothetical protein GQ53DRAFT_765786 [Thozetella sp. PMI_491]|nr:hypothetical protein GQ53DRAFT_765786 [Thozetella sp. PMI_491]